MNHKKPLFILPALIAGLGLLNGCSADHHVAASEPQTIRNMSVITARFSNTPDLLEAVGTLRAAQTSQLASQVTGTIMEVRVREGDRVKQGQVLAVIDDAELRAAVDRAVATDLAARQELAATEADLTLSDSTLKRYQSLYVDKVVSSQALEEVQARQRAALAHRDLAGAGQAQAQAVLAQARTNLGYTRIRAPFDGTITERKLDPGTLAGPGIPIVSVEDISHYRLDATVNENDLRYVRLGKPVPVLIDALGDLLVMGRVAQIIPAADPASRSFLIKIDLPAGAELRSGLFARAQFSRGERAGLLIPETAVIQRGQLQGVYVLGQNQIAALRYVTLGKSTADQVEVLAGIQNGELVVARPGEMDLSGKRIEAAQ